MEKKALGRGLEALLPSRSGGETPNSGESIQQVPVTQIIPNRFQPRHIFVEDDLKTLADSIGQNGILQPILVRRTGDGLFELIAGERRFRAAKMSRLEFVPAIIRNTNDNESTILALVENIQRQDLNPMEEARSYSRLMKEFQLTQEILSEKVGKDRSSIANFVRLVSLPSEIQRMLEEGALSMGHAKVILGVSGPARQVSLAQKIVREHLSVRGAEKEAMRLSGGGKRKKPAGNVSNSPDNVSGLEEQLRRRLGTKVVIRSGSRGGEIGISFYSQEDLTRIMDVLLA